MNDLELLKYPVGRFEMPAKISKEDVQSYIRILENLSAELIKTVENFDDEKFATQYRTNGWTVQQVITHVADAHSRAYGRFKQGLQENKIVVKPHNEKKLADFVGSNNSVVQTALKTIYDVHESWVLDLKSLSGELLNLTFFYPDAGRQMSLPQFLAIFAWHSQHHFAHIKSLKDRMEW
ncbi:putative metal-dependent hydrolase [Pedobacter aquatilis]|uniref:YfiT family bacillithiol transferase n=1 Tax=Pedobacter aquatilis TaxID=351343 RepID=UPI0025B552D0|nr:putative metal-dependent hydrolase [Pedobacter aquatilis]MDN3586072.1 putative metal-dependent hydrolase [Pedobacter aquatilis]